MPTITLSPNEIISSDYKFPECSLTDILIFEGSGSLTIKGDIPYPCILRGMDELILEGSLPDNCLIYKRQMGSYENEFSPIDSVVISATGSMGDGCKIFADIVNVNGKIGRNARFSDQLTVEDKGEVGINAVFQYSDMSSKLYLQDRQLSCKAISHYTNESSDNVRGKSVYSYGSNYSK